MIINSSIIDNDFCFIEEAHLVIEDGIIIEVGDGFVSNGVDAKQYIIMPSLINAHTHIGDSFAKEGVLGLNVEDAVGPRGLKHKLYENANESIIIRCMNETLKYMLDTGTTTFSDFREHGVKGINLLKKSLKDNPMKSVILGRYVDPKECDGIGINVDDINTIPKDIKDIKDKILAIHIGEVKNETKYVLNYNPNVIIHFVHTNPDDMKKISRKGISVIVCPRSNATLGAGYPMVRQMLDAKINVGIGTDNVMINSPNMFREMEFLSRLSYLYDPVSPVEILKMATLNSANAFGINSGVIEKGRSADLIFIDKNAPNIKDNRNMIATIIHRTEPENVRKVMIDGRIVVDKDII